MGKFNTIKNVMNFCGYGYTQEELKNMSKEQLSHVKFAKTVTQIAGVIGCATIFYGLGKASGRRYKKDEWIGIYNSGANDMFNCLKGRLERVPFWRRDYIIEHADLAEKGVIA